MSDLISRLGKRYPTGYSPFVWSGGQSWTFAYSNRAPIRTLAIAFVVAHPAGPMGEVELRRLRAARQIARDLASACNASFGEIWFAAGRNGFDDLCLDQTSLSEPKLRDWFADCGLKVKSGHVVKSVNWGMASYFSTWQRDNLGSIIITDIDLVRTHMPDGTAGVIYELKRSYRSLEDWNPYRTDFPNFDVLSQVASEAGVSFRILYNYYSRGEAGQQRVDDASKVALFSYSSTHQSSSRLGLVTFEDFVNGVIPRGI